MEYLRQSNNSADLVSEEDRFKFVDDLSVLEIVNLLKVGLTSYLTSQYWLDEINKWTLNQQMLINEKKTKNLVFNFTDKYQFATRLRLNDEIVEILESTKLLGTILSDDLRWDLNTKNIVKKANARMELLRRVASFGVSVEDRKTIYFLFIRSLLEQSATVWHSSLT